MSNCESCGCQGSVIEVVYDKTQQDTQHEQKTVSVAASPTEDELISSDDKPP